MLYEDDTLQLAADDDAPSLAPSVFDAVADLIYKAGGFDINQVKDPAARKLLIETAAAINRGVNTHLPTDVPDTLRYALEENSFIFSGFKTFHAMREIGLSLLNDKGELLGPSYAFNESIPDYIKFLENGLKVFKQQEQNK